MNKKMYFSTGEFAKLAGVSKHTLFYYDCFLLRLKIRKMVIDITQQRS